MNRHFELQLIKVLQIQSYSGRFRHMSRFIFKELESMGLSPYRDHVGNIYVVKGEAEIYPSMVCHIDTVHMYNPNYEVHQTKDKLFAIDTKDCNRLGIGGDDKVGIFITLQMIKHYDNFKAAFFVDEEIGCVGSSQCDFTFFNDCSFVLECDRKGNKDFVSKISWTKLYSDEFSEAIKPILTKYGRQEVDGGMTDVLMIAESTEICVANMSCGYYLPHTDNEWVSISDVYNTYMMCMEFFDELSTKLWRINEQDRMSYIGGYGYGYSSYGTGGYLTNTNIKTFDDWKKENQSIEVDDVFGDELEDLGISFVGKMECFNCGYTSAVHDEFTNDIECSNCGSAMTMDEYLDIAYGEKH
jgi:tripeptide aminopeptidase